MQVVEISQVELSEETGMGRVTESWREAFSRAGHGLGHVGPSEVGRVHPARFARSAHAWLRARAPVHDLLLVHEPSAAPFVGGGRPVFVYSHGLERRSWETALEWAPLSGERIAWRSRVLFPLWRLRACDRGLRLGDHLFVLNREDRDFCQARYRRPAQRVSLIRNGVDEPSRREIPRKTGEPTILFVGSWLPRKGIRILALAAELVRSRGVRAKWILAGTGSSREEVLRAWPPGLWDVTEIATGHERAEEGELFSSADLFVLPSFFEGQPLALLQAMASGLCCISTATCGQRDLIRHSENGLLVEPGDATGLADEISRVLADERMRSELGEAARISVAGRSWVETGDEFVHLVESAYRGCGGA